MSTIQKLLGALLALAVTGLMGYYYGKGDKEVVVQEQIVYREAETQIVYRDRIVTVIKERRPDGTVTETTTTEESDKTVTEKKKKLAEVSKDTSSTPIPAQYSLGLSIQGDVTRGIEALTQPNYRATLGRRILGPIWIEAGASSSREVSLGVRVEL